MESLKDIIGFNKRKRVIAPINVGEESPDTSLAHAGQAYGLTTRRGNTRGANRDAECRKARGVPLDAVGLSNGTSPDGNIKSETAKSLLGASPLWTLDPDGNVGTR